MKIAGQALLLSSAFSLSPLTTPQVQTQAQGKALQHK